MRKALKFQYGRVVWNETLDDFLPGFKSAWRMMIEGLLTAGLIFSAYQRSGLDAGSDYAIKAAIGIGCLIASFIFIHFAVSWATAPRRVFYKNQKEIADLRRLELNRERLRGLVNLLEEMQTLRNTISKSNDELSQWITDRDALIKTVHDKIAEISDIDARNFVVVTGVPALSHIGSQSQWHSDQISGVMVRIEKLQALIDRYSAMLDRLPATNATAAQIARARNAR
jgi:hypothetical protein